MESSKAKEVIELLNEMGRSEYKSIKSQLKILLVHLLKFDFQREKVTPSWLSSISYSFDEVEDGIEESPSILNKLEKDFDKIYSKAEKIAIRETGLDSKKFPSKSPYELSNILKEKHFAFECKLIQGKDREYEVVRKVEGGGWKNTE